MGGTKLKPVPLTPTHPPTLPTYVTGLTVTARDSGKRAIQHQFLEPSYSLGVLAKTELTWILQLALWNKSSGPEEHKSRLILQLSSLWWFEKGQIFRFVGSRWWNIQVLPLFQRTEARIVVHADTPESTLQVVHGGILFCFDQVFYTEKFPGKGCDSDSSTYTWKWISWSEWNDTMCNL